LEELGFPARQVTALFNPIDEKFFSASVIRAKNDKEDYVFSCGLENRNYPLLCKAAAILPYQFRVAASGFMSLSGFEEQGRPDVPANVILEDRLSFDDLKQTYARARIIVVPLNNVPYGAGVTSLLEAMAMGKPLIVTASTGIEEYIRPGLSAFVVPPDDPAALADAIRTLWDDSARCAEMGRHNRAWIESAMKIDSYCEKVAAIVGGAAI
jgi:glycosyltransferase involved in cell wall biosynthesis